MDDVDSDTFQPRHSGVTVTMFVLGDHLEVLISCQVKGAGKHILASSLEVVTLSVEGCVVRVSIGSTCGSCWRKGVVLNLRW